MLAALAGATSRIGLIATCSTTYTEPFNLARQFASLDHISARAGGLEHRHHLACHARRGNYGGAEPLSHADRYERAEEYMQVVTGLWDSWVDDAVLDDRDRRRATRGPAASGRSTTAGRTTRWRGR